MLPTKGLRAGEYDVALRSSGGKVLSKAQVWLYAKVEPTRVSVGESRYRAGEPIDISWSNAPGMGLDWISVFACQKNTCDADSDYLVHTHTGSQIEGHATIGPDSIGAEDAWPLKPGRYVVRQLPDDGALSVADSKVFPVS